MSARILVVDDVPANVKLLEARLSAEYFDVLTATNGAEALDICSRAECDIILLDIMMPDMDGFGHPVPPLSQELVPRTRFAKQARSSGASAPPPDLSKSEIKLASDSL